MHTPVTLPLLRRLVRWLAYAICQLALLMAFGLRALVGGHFPFSFGAHTATKASFCPPAAGAYCLQCLQPNTTALSPNGEEKESR